MYMKYHFLATHRQKHLTKPETIRIFDQDPENSKRQLWGAIQDGKESFGQPIFRSLIPMRRNKLGFDPFDVIKVWHRKQFPVCVPKIPRSASQNLY